MTERTKPVPPSKEETGSLEGTPTKTYTSAPDSTARNDIPASPVVVMPPPLPWARHLIESADDPVPEYGSDEWLTLPDKSRVKVAACVKAAEAWRTYWLPEEHTRRLRAELDAARAYEAEPGYWTPDVVEAVHRTARQPSHAELSRRRGEPEAEVRANAHRRRLGLPVDERPSTKCEGDQHDWGVFTITTDWPQDADQPHQWRCRRCLLFGRPAPKLRVVRDA